MHHKTNIAKKHIFYLYEKDIASSHIVINVNFYDHFVSIQTKEEEDEKEKCPF